MNRFQRNPNLERDLLREPAFRGRMVGAGRAVHHAAEQIAPKGATLHYARSFRTVPTPTGARVDNTDFAAHLVEYGSVNNPAYGVLRRAVGVAGLRLEEGSPE